MEPLIKIDLNKIASGGKPVILDIGCGICSLIQELYEENLCYLLPRSMVEVTFTKEEWPAL